MLALPATPSPATLLIARFGVVPFAHREQELAELDAWALGDDPVSVRPLHGAGGMGKTRLARHWARLRRAAGWHAGFLRDDETVTEDDEGLIPRWAAAALSARAPTAVIIDYAESRRWLPKFLHALARDDVRPRAKVRVLLLARNRGDWWEALKATDADRVRALLEYSPQPRHIASLVVHSAAAQEAEALRAARAFAEHLKRPAPDRVPLPSARRRERVLYLHMAALNAVLGGAAPNDAAADGDPLRDSILTHERRFWLRHNGLPLETKDAPLVRALDRLMAAATLLDGVSDARHARALLGGLGADAGQVRAAAATAHTLYATPATYIGRLEPDVLGEWLVYRVLSDPLELDPLLEPWLGQADPDALTHAFTVLGRIEVDRADAGKWCEDALRADLSGRADAALRAALALGADTADGRLGPRLAGAFSQADDATALADRVAATLPPADRTVSLRELGHWAHGLRHRLLAPDSSPSDRAILAVNFAVWASAVGDREGAPASTSEGADAFRELVEGGDDSFRGHLATSLNNLGNMLSDLGRREEALSATEEAVSIRRELASSRPDAFLPDLARSLNSLGVRLSALGRREEALSATEEAVSIRRELASSRPDVFLPDLARAVSVRGDVHAAAGAAEAARADARESLELLWPFFERLPAGYGGLMRALVSDCTQRFGEDPLPDWLAPYVSTYQRLTEPEADAP